MANNLHRKQLRFAKMFHLLLDFARKNGYEWKIGWAYRDKETAKRLGMENSLHTKVLAIDLELYKDGKYLTKTIDHLELGKYWESLGGSWGGRFNDGNHYSLEHEGKK